MRPPPIRVDHDLSFAPLDLLASIVAPRAAALGGLNALAVEHSSTRRSLASDPLPVGHDEQVVHRLEQAGIPPRAKPSVHGRARRQIGRKQPPRNAAAQYIEDRVHNLAQRPFPWPPSRERLRHERLDQSPLRVGQIRFVTQPVAAMLPPSGWGPHREFQVGFDNPWESRLPWPLNLFRDGLLARGDAAMAAQLLPFFAGIVMPLSTISWVLFH